MNVKHNFILKYLRPYDLLALFYCVFALILSEKYDFRIDFSSVFQVKYDITFAILLILYAVIYLALIALKFRRIGKDSFLCGPEWRKHVRNRILSPGNILELLRVLIILKLTLLIYCNIKQAIPFINPHLYDSELMAADRILHFGFNPNTAAVHLLKPFSSVIDKLYIIWYILKPLILAYFAILPDRILAARFFSAYFAIWIFGGISALLIPSLGPVYIHPEWFAGLHKPFADNLQHKLMTHYQAALSDPSKYKVFIYEGIAAFPSLHVGIVALFTFFLLKTNKTAGIAMGAYTLVVQAGSVLLGWHYAIDGYFAVAVAFVLYKISGYVFKHSE